MAEPVSLSEAKLHLRVDSADEDTLISGFIVAARRWVENFTGLVLVQREVTDSFDHFTTQLQLSAWPVALDAEVAIGYLDSAGVAQAVGDYRLRTGSRPAYLWPITGASWPYAERVRGAITATYTAGYATAEEVPQELKAAILLLLGHWYANREAVSVGNITTELPLAVESLCYPHRLMVIG